MSEPIRSRAVIELLLEFIIKAVDQWLHWEGEDMLQQNAYVCSRKLNPFNVLVIIYSIVLFDFKKKNPSKPKFKMFPCEAFNFIIAVKVVERRDIF